MGGACSLKLAKRGAEKYIEHPQFPHALSPHHLKHRAAVTMKSGSLLGKDVGNKIQESLSILLRVDSRESLLPACEEGVEQGVSPHSPPLLPSPLPFFPPNISIPSPFILLPPHCSGTRGS